MPSSHIDLLPVSTPGRPTSGGRRSSVKSTSSSDDTPVSTSISQEFGKSKDSRGDLLESLFGLTQQRVIEDYSCAISETILLHGRMYVTEDAVAFYSNIFGREVRKVLPYDRWVLRVVADLLVSDSAHLF